MSGNNCEPRISDEFVLTPSLAVSQEVERRLQAMKETRVQLMDQREATTGIPKDSVLHRVAWDHVSCADDLRRLLRCGEQHIDMIFCSAMKHDYYRCRQRAAWRA